MVLRAKWSDAPTTIPRQATQLKQGRASRMKSTSSKGCNSIVLVERTSSTLVGYARVITDYVFKALIFDVTVDEAYWGNGLGRRLLDALVDHPELRRVKHLELYCLPEMVPFYKKWGFSNDAFSRLAVLRKTAG
jgi:predicted GNAT family N-acyltransferase